jgi:hypothetical protein
MKLKIYKCSIYLIFNKDATKKMKNIILRFEKEKKSKPYAIFYIKNNKIRKI